MATHQIVPTIWLNDQAQAAVDFYGRAFNDVIVIRTNYYTEAGKEDHGHQPGSVVTIDFTIYGQRFVALNGGPIFTPTPANSFFVRCSSADEANQLWKKLSEGATVLMPIGEHPFSEAYGWLNDQFGVSWQIIFTEEDVESVIVPALMFTGENSGKAVEAIDFYTSIFAGASTGAVSFYEEEDAPNAAGKVAYGEFVLADITFAIMDSAVEQDFNFTPGISYMVVCDSQKEIDHYWSKLSAVPEAEQCGWLVDKYGVSWQIVPQIMDDMLSTGTPEQIERVTAAFMQMKKIDIATLEQAFNAA